ncbi:hypothetical protein ASE01_08725 [Nocardioides sp. Root190]|uniref:hypothetical protein n=1 Tax=Nocardioides sp. Root190 TaxID=1736488 RepID=UPI0007016AA2|nr:hypothetical protein [Nocardioides sp. Root190]KRB76848.1 hypothetical protein ASE01_08725 [Nocardioides sp. Root190]
MRGAADAEGLDGEVPGMPEEFTGPVAYDDRWLWIAVALLVLVVLYYLASWWFTRPRRVRIVAGPPVDVPDARAEHLARIDELVARVQDGRTSARGGHQQLSEIVRSWVATVTTLPARTMALADFRDRAPQELVEAIELMYPPEFAPDVDAAPTFEDAVQRARRLVGSWT